MTSELRHAVWVWRDAAYATEVRDLDPYKASAAQQLKAAAVIEADREAVRAEQAAELAKWKALAETLAGALEAMYGATPLHDEGCDGGLLGCTCDLRAANQKAEPALRAYEEFRRG